jgi:hypothetical protein
MRRHPGSVPSFLYIGAPRTGSTWLHLNLQRHPQVWVPPCKNVAYFHPRFQIYRLQKFRRHWKEAFVDGDLATCDWYRRFFTRPFVGDRWYRDLFPTGLITGEIAEAYCSLERDGVRRIQAMMPEVKIIYALRGPVERALSQAKLGMVVRKDRRIDDVPAHDFLRHINSPGSQARTRYTRTLDVWSAFFPAQQLLILFYEDLLGDPRNYLRTICRFIGVEFDERHFRRTMTATAKKSVDQPLPDVVVRHAARKYRGEVAELAARFGGPARQWQQRVEEILRRPR